MCFSPIPKFTFRCVTEITPVFLKKNGVSFLMLDLDNTVARYSDNTPPPNIVRWAELMRKSGIMLFIVSNNHRTNRVAEMSKMLGAGFISSAGKPSPRGVLTAMRLAGRGRGESALAGDQVYTDVLAANFAGVTSIAVPPMNNRSIFFALRYALEFPFRLMCRNKMWRVSK